MKNLSNVMERVMWMETLTAVKAAGIDPRQYAEMLKSVMRGSAISDWEKIIRIEDGEVSPTRPGGNIFRKDVPHALKFLHELGLKLPLAEGTGEPPHALWPSAKCALKPRNSGDASARANVDGRVPAR